MQSPYPPVRHIDIHEAAPPAAAPSEPATAWAQLGAYRTRRKAEAVVKIARAASFPADPPPPVRISPVRLRGGLWWRIVAGPLTRTDGQALCQRFTTATDDPCLLRDLP